MDRGSEADPPKTRDPATHDPKTRDPETRDPTTHDPKTCDPKEAGVREAGGREARVQEARVQEAGGQEARLQETDAQSIQELDIFGSFSFYCPLLWLSFFVSLFFSLALFLVPGRDLKTPILRSPVSRTAWPPAPPLQSCRRFSESFGRDLKTTISAKTTFGAQARFSNFDVGVRGASAKPI